MRATRQQVAFDCRAAADVMMVLDARDVMNLKSGERGCCVSVTCRFGGTAPKKATQNFIKPLRAGTC